MQKFGFASQGQMSSAAGGNTMAAQSSLKTKLGGLEVSLLTNSVASANGARGYLAGNDPPGQRRDPVLEARGPDAQAGERAA